MKARRVVKRVKFSVDGAQCLIRVYTDSSARIIIDHPSNDPVAESFLAGRVSEYVRHFLEARGWHYVIGPVAWRSDPNNVRVIR